MKLIFIYGPPAVGKLTVAKELAKLTNYKVFHNHLTIDLIKNVLDWGSKTFFDLSKKFRVELFVAAAKTNVSGVIFTVCYSHPDDDKFVKEVIKKVENHGGQVHFVQLICDKTQLNKRVTHASRENFDKTKVLKKVLEPGTCFR